MDFLEFHTFAKIEIIRLPKFGIVPKMIGCFVIKIDPFEKNKYKRQKMARLKQLC